MMLYNVSWGGIPSNLFLFIAARRHSMKSKQCGSFMSILGWSSILKSHLNSEKKHLMLVSKYQGDCRSTTDANEKMFQHRDGQIYAKFAVATGQNTQSRQFLGAKLLCLIKDQRNHEYAGKSHSFIANKVHANLRLRGP